MIQMNLFIHPQGNGDGGIGGGVFIARKGQAQALSLAPASPLRPTRTFGNGFKHGAGAGIGQHGQPVIQRVLAGPNGQIIDHGFQRKDIGQGAQGTQGGGADRGCRHQMVQNTGPGNIVIRRGVAGTAAAGFLQRILRHRSGGRIGQSRRRQQETTARAWALHMGRAPNLRCPIGWPPCIIKVYFQVHQHRRPEGFVGEFFLPPPLQPDTAAGLVHGDYSGVEGDIIGAIVAIATRTAEVSGANGFDGQLQHFGDIAAQGMHALAMGPNRQMAIAELRQGA